MDRLSGLVDRTSSSQAKVALFRRTRRIRDDVMQSVRDGRFPPVLTEAQRSLPFPVADGCSAVLERISGVVRRSDDTLGDMFIESTRHVVRPRPGLHRVPRYRRLDPVVWRTAVLSDGTTACG